MAKNLRNGNGNFWSSVVAKTIDVQYLSSEEIDNIIKFVDDSPETNNTYLMDNPLYKYVRNRDLSIPLRNILSSVRRHYKGFALMEHHYLDPEYWDSHSGYYSRSFSQYNLDSTRIHFFKGTERKVKDLLDLLHGGACRKDIEDKTDFRWKGYCVLRPIPYYNVGRTAIIFDDEPDESLLFEEEKGGKPYLKARQLCSANLFNAYFASDQTTEFIQQDPNLGHCATSSLWVASNVMAKKFGMHKFHYRTITQQAIGNWDRELEIKRDHSSSTPENGLTPSEIKNVVSAMGASFLEFTNKQGFVSLFHEIYSFMESGFPVLLCLSNDKSRHVVSVVGHSLPKIETIDNCTNASAFFTGIKESRLMSRHCLIGNMINVYYVHDDSYGPFNRLILQRTEEGVNNVTLGKERTSCVIDRAIIPIEPMIKVPATNVFRDLVSWFNDNYAVSYLNEEIFLWRSLLLKGSDYKQSICRRGFVDKLKARYATMHLPKYIWLFELSIVEKEGISDYFYHKEYKARQIDGDFIYDATSPPKHVRLLSARLSGIYMDYTDNFSKIEVEGQKYNNCYEYSCQEGECNECRKQ